MTKRIKITGYLDVDDMDPTHVDLDHPTGLTSKGYDEVTSIFADNPYKISDLTDIDTKVVDD